MQVTRRNTERFHAFAHEVARHCGIYDLQGLLLNEAWEPTSAVEAYELSEPLGGRQIAGTVISADDLYVKCVFAEQVGVPLYLLTHVREHRGVDIYEFQADHHTKLPRCVSAESKSDAQFVAWWRERKQTVQTKAYRSDLSGRIARSYFDAVLESNGEKWGGNIDGYLVSWDSGDVEIWGIVENRFTNKVALSCYDPQRYFRYGGGDYYTWLPLVNLSRQMQIPLFLTTYSNRQGSGQQDETHSAGLTGIESLTQEGITYWKNRAGEQIHPCRNILSDAEAIRRWYHGGGI